MAIKKKEPRMTRDMISVSTRADSTDYAPYQQRPYNPDDLWQQKANYDLIDDMMQDDQISASMHLKKLLILDNQWKVVSENEEVSDFITENLNNISGGIESKLYDILSGMEYGWSFSELVFEILDQKICLKDILTRAPHAFTIYQDEYGNIKYLEQTTGGDNPVVITNLEKYIHYVHRPRFANPYGQSILNKSVYDSFWAKKIIKRFWNIYLERFGAPTAIGKYPQKYDSLKADLKSALDDIQTKTSIVLPEEIAVELLEADRGNGDSNPFMQRIDHADTKIARSLLIPDLLGYSGDNKISGSYALGQEQFGIFYTILQKYREELARLINYYVIRPLEFWNFGTSEAYFEYVSIDNARNESVAKHIIELFKSGAPINLEQLNYLAQSLEMPEFEEEDFENKKEPAIPAEEPEEEAGETPVDDGEVSEDDAEELTYKFASEEDNISKEINDMDQVEEKYIEETGDILQGIIDKIINQSNKVIESGRIKRIRTINISNRERTKLIRKLRESLAEAYTVGSSSLDVELSDYGNYIVFADLEDWFTEISNFAANAEVDELVKLALPIIADGLKNELNSKDIIAQVAEKLSDAAKVRSERLVRTLIAKGYNGARFERYSQIKDRIKGFRYIAIMDDRTSPICERLHTANNGYYSFEDAKKINPPNHFNCRSVIRAVFTDVEKGGKIPENFVQEGDFFKIKKS